MINNIKSALKNSIIYGAGNVSTKLVGFVLLPLYTKHLSVSDYGILGLLEITGQVLIAFFGLRIYSAFFRWYWDEDSQNKQKSIFFTIYIFSIVIALLMIIMISNYSEQIAIILFNDSSSANLIFLMTIVSGFQIVDQIILTLMRLQEKAVFYSVSNVLKLLIVLIFTIYFIAYDNQEIVGIYNAQIIGHVFFTILYLPYLFKNAQIKFEYKILTEMLSYCWPLIFSSLAHILMTITDRYMLKFFGQLSDVGIYSLGFKIANSINVIIIMPVQLAVSPMVFKKMYDPDSNRFYSKLMSYFTYGVMVFVLGISLYSKDIVVLLANNEEYWQAYNIIPIISFSILFSMLGSTAQTGLLIKKKTKIVTIVTILTAGFNIIMNIFLILYLKAIGAAIATLISQIAFFIIIYNFAQKYYYISYEILNILKLIIVGMVIIMFSYILNTIPIFLSITLKTILFFSFPFLLYILHFYEKVELLYLKNIFRKLKLKRF
ncbi:MAG: oligosaccharide flippase family protein [Calditrichaceae bacterium]|nr:oligosaccharide flippase family protein [Calditrichaceae bacterium]MBN2710271.1 oligosaccharide flippase family protein [Calditrichaceae bacterium]RQV93892.1 MAG: hypothetical protein EH224_11745 [Calditrichota bacterium]